MLCDIWTYVYNVEFSPLSLLNCRRIWSNSSFVVRGFVALALTEVVCLESGDLECGVVLLGVVLLDLSPSGDFEVALSSLAVTYSHKLWISSRSLSSSDLVFRIILQYPSAYYKVANTRDITRLSNQDLMSTALTRNYVSQGVMTGAYNRAWRHDRHTVQR